MDKREETLEEINLDNKKSIDSKIEPDKMIEDVLNDVSLKPDTGFKEEKMEEIKEEIKPVDNKTNISSNGNTDSKESVPVNSDDVSNSNSSDEYDDYEYSFMSSGKKKAIIAILSILLVLDIAALAIYLIGIDKVLSFIK